MTSKVSPCLSAPHGAVDRRFAKLLLISAAAMLGLAAGCAPQYEVIPPGAATILANDRGIKTKPRAVRFLKAKYDFEDIDETRATWIEEEGSGPIDTVEAAVEWDNVVKVTIHQIRDRVLNPQTVVLADANGKETWMLNHKFRPTFDREGTLAALKVLCPNWGSPFVAESPPPPVDISQPPPAPPDAATPPAVTGEPPRVVQPPAVIPIRQKLEDLKKLFDDGLITEDNYHSMQKKILEEMFEQE